MGWGLPLSGRVRQELLEGSKHLKPSGIARGGESVPRDALILTGMRSRLWDNQSWSDDGKEKKIR
jgi:hypothetical protein